MSRQLRSGGRWKRFRGLKLKKLVDIYQVNGILDWYCASTTTAKVTVKTQATQYAVPPAATDPADPTAKSLHVEAP
jgi:hypothetical protein